MHTDATGFTLSTSRLAAATVAGDDDLLAPPPEVDETAVGWVSSPTGRPGTSLSLTLSISRVQLPAGSCVLTVVAH
jgi:hypothetical protein